MLNEVNKGYDILFTAVNAMFRMTHHNLLLTALLKLDEQHRPLL